jgi:uracil-DNA glycosylase
VTAQELDRINAQIVGCVRCPRLVEWREAAARNPPRRYAGQPYWGKPLPGFGDPAATVLVVGLAPAAHGGNRTGRIFTGDRSGDFLFAALHRAGYANQPTSTHPGDGLRLDGMYIAAVNRCAPPANLPTPGERANCRGYLVDELRALHRLRVIVCLGGFAWQGTLQALAVLGLRPVRRPPFGHGSTAAVGRYQLLGSYHPSQQNTFTRRLTTEMMVEVFGQARRLAGQE